MTGATTEIGGGGDRDRPPTCGPEAAVFPLLSVIIPTLNEAEALPPLLADLRRQQGLTLEVIVGDGGSTDGTREVVEAAGARCIAAQRGRGVQMNAAAAAAGGEWLLFLHADSRLPAPDLLAGAVAALQRAAAATPRVAGHFSLRFLRTTAGRDLAYRYLEAKTALNRVNTTNGDQGLLLSRAFFRELGGFDEGLPFLEDQRIAEEIRRRGVWMTLPGKIWTSARRFETEGFHRRYLLMGIMMGMHSIGMESFFARAPGVYRAQRETGRLRLSPFFVLLWSMIRYDWGWAGTVRVFYRLGRYIRQNAWQPFFFVDVWLQSIRGAHRAPLLALHDRFVAPILACRPVDAVVGLGCFVWYMGVLSLWFGLTETPFTSLLRIDRK